MAVKNSAGEVLGNYNLLEKVGEGSMGTVYKASHWMTREIVAVKVMPSNIARKPMLLKRFEQEFRIASKVEHPNVVRVLEYSGAGPEPYLVMEFVDGVSVGDRIEKHGRMPEEDAVRIIVQVSEGLHHAHGLGLLHRDVKPDNILMTPDGQAKLTDLGLAKEIDAAVELTRTGSGLGTPNFMAPEQFRNAKNADVRCDVYSLGATLYQMVSGELPFGHGDPVRIMMRKLNNELTPLRKLAPHVSERTEGAIQRAMNPEPEQRQASCQEFLDELLGRPTVAPAASGPSDAGMRVTPGAGGDTESVRRSMIEARLAEGSSGRAGWSLPRSAPVRPAILEGVRPLSDGEALAPEAPPFPVADAPPPSATALSSARYLPPANAGPPSVHDVAVTPPPAAQSLDGWKTALLIALTAVGTLFLSQIFFPIFK